MDKKVSAALEKLNKTLSAIAESMTQLQLDVAKIGARVSAIDSEIASLGRRLRIEGNGSSHESLITQLHTAER
jgi:predicted  nucleic acid-binding Zn-ribbon protein